MPGGQPRASSTQYISPSQRDGISPSAETIQLAYAADLIRECSHALRLSQPVCVTAQMLLHRFYTCVSLRAHATIWTAGAAVLLSAKLADQPRTLRHVANVLNDRVNTREGVTDIVRWQGEGRLRPLDFFGAAGYDWKHELIATERHVLKELGFRLMVELPHKFVLIFVNTLRDKCGAPAWTQPGVQEYRKLLQRSWNYANDVMRIRVCVAEEPEAIACACISLGATHCSGRLPEGWQIVFGTSKEECARLVGEIRSLYEVPSAKGMLVDYSLSSAFERHHPGQDSVGAKRQGNASNILQLADGDVARATKRSRFVDREG